MKRLALNILSILMLGSGLLAQEFTQVVRGRVFDAETQSPIPLATVYMNTTEPVLGTITDQDGYFRLDKVPVGRHNVVASSIGYDTKIVPEIMVSTGKEVILDISLVEKTVSIDEVVVKAYTRKDEPINSMSSVSARTFSVEEAQRYAGGFDDPARLASSFAGVTTGFLDDNAITVRGNAPKGLLWRLESVEIPNPNHFAGMTSIGGGGVSALSSLMLANSDFATGAFPAEYGNALSGVFDLKLRTGNNENHEHAIQVGALGIDLSSEGPVSKTKRSSYLFNYRYSTFGIIKNVLPEGANIPVYQDLCFKFNFPTKKHGQFSIWGLAKDDKLGFEAETDTALWRYSGDQYDGYAIQRMGVIALNHKMILNSKTYTNTSLSLSGEKLRFDKDYLNFEMNRYPSTRIDNTNYKYSFTTNINHKYSAKHASRSGITINHYDYQTQMKYTPTPGQPLISAIDENGTSYLAQAYTQSKLSLNEKFTANIGLYGQFFQLNKEIIIEPRASLRYDINQEQSISLAYGKHSRMDPLSLYFTEITEDGNIIQPNKNLDFSKAHHFVFAYDRNLNECMRLKIEPYLQLLYDIPVVKNTSYSLINLKQAYYFIDKMQNSGTGTNIGIDITLERFLNAGFYYLFTASVFKSNYIGGDNIERMTRFNRNCVVNLLYGKEWVFGRKNDKILGLSGRLNIMGGQRIIPIDEAKSIIQEEIVYDDSRAFEDQEPFIYFLNASATLRINKKKYSGLWTFQVLNSLGYKQYYGSQFNFRTKEIDREELVVIVPNISYKIEF